MNGQMRVYEALTVVLAVLTRTSASETSPPPVSLIEDFFQDGGELRARVHEQMLSVLPLLHDRQTTRTPRHRTTTINPYLEPVGGYGVGVMYGGHGAGHGYYVIVNPLSFK